MNPKIPHAHWHALKTDDEEKISSVSKSNYL